ncbi:TRAP transporter small permease [Celeribacter indicus]|uniref:TRAP transporter small permease protein n=1 Tax=Celeribacter indicus TaxID=1208324 RepID=A0A0B5DX98_9RHOB|nr:TRAP transporter small permease [Celeribacter indicus]AJE44887.1 TRAP dicarboxylate transporter subunit DctQ [Celeribacter indicus]SDX22711.1 TRAP-type C4-dicarboxylate transport system, small permease component [Celeribacter indicus]
MNTVLRSYDRLIVGLGHLPGILILCMAVGVSVDVLMRNLGYGGLEYTVDAVRYCILFITMSGAAWVLRLGRHVRMDVVVAMLPRRGRVVAEAFVLALSAAVSAVLAWYGVTTVADSYRSGAMLYLSFDIPEWMPLTLVPFGFTLFTLESLRGLWIVLTTGIPSEADHREEI